MTVELSAAHRLLPRALKELRWETEDFEMAATRPDRKIKGLGLAVTAVTPRGTGEGVTGTNAFDSGMISSGGIPGSR